jgi:hypothetical protein
MARVFVHLKDDNAVEFSGDFDGVGDLDGFRIAVFRRRHGIALKEKTAALLQGAFRGTGEMGHAEFGIRPDCDRGERTPVRIPEENHAAPHASEHAALKRQPALAERLGVGGLDKLPPQISVKLSTGWPF